MPTKPRPGTEERTPLARLTERGVHAIVGYQLAQATLVTNQVFDERVGRDGLRRVEFTILALIRDNADVTARQLARALAVTPPNIAIWLDKLEARGWVVRTRSSADARMQHLRLTPRARTLVEATQRALLEGEREALGMLSAAEHAMLVELLHKVALGRRRPEPER
jgi:DNA-binding MarR family transcriptional regulator